MSSVRKCKTARGNKYHNILYLTQHSQLREQNAYHIPKYFCKLIHQRVIPIFLVTDSRRRDCDDASNREKNPPTKN